MTQDFSFRIEAGLASLIFTRPDKANALHPRMIAGMTEAFAAVLHEPSVRCVLVRGEGKHFMAGGDLESIVDFDRLSDAQRTLLGEGPIFEYNRMIRVMQRLDVPVVASVQGGVAGAAVGFIGACDLVIAAKSAFFWAAHILHGGSNDGLLTYFTPRHIGLRKALELALLGDRIGAEEAQRLGLINFVVPDADLESQTERLVQRLLRGPTRGYGAIKRLMYASFDNSMQEQGRLEAESYGCMLQTEDVRDGLKAFFERRDPSFKGR